VTGALLSAALAVLLWPDRHEERSRRAAGLTRAPGRRVPRLPRTAELPVPLGASAVAVAVAATLSTPMVAVLAGVAAHVGARSWVAARGERIQEGRLVGLAEGLGALTAELRAGRALGSATSAAVAACGNDESGRALARAVRVPQSGFRPHGAAAAGPDDPVISAVDRISAAVLLSTRTGCSLADVLAAVHDDLRARRRHRQELGAATAAPRASAMLLAGLPLLGLAMGSGIGADPWHVLTSTAAGQVLLVAGVAFELAGLAWSRRLVDRVVR
jgi:tight adherence protein B